jgi:hypothetical protein
MMGTGLCVLTNVIAGTNLVNGRHQFCAQHRVLLVSARLSGTGARTAE